MKHRAVQLGTLVRCAAGSFAIAGAALLIVYGLPRIQSEQIGVRLLARLGQQATRGSLITVDGHDLHARCRSLTVHKQLIVFSDGSIVTLHGVRLLQARHRAVEPRGRQRSRAERRAALAFLAGSYRLYYRLLAFRITSGLPLLEGQTTMRGRKLLRIRLGRDHPRLELLVASRTLRPLSATYSSARMRGSAYLLPPHTATGLGC